MLVAINHEIRATVLAATFLVVSASVPAPFRFAFVRTEPIAAVNLAFKRKAALLASEAAALVKLVSKVLEVLLVPLDPGLASVPLRCGDAGLLGRRALVSELVVTDVVGPEERLQVGGIVVRSVMIDVVDVISRWHASPVVVESPDLSMQKAAFCPSGCAKVQSQEIVVLIAEALNFRRDNDRNHECA